MLGIECKGVLHTTHALLYLLALVVNLGEGYKGVAWGTRNILDFKMSSQRLAKCVPKL